MSKKDGQRIILTFSQKIISDANLAKDAISLLYKEYDMTPEGKLINIERSPISVKNISANKKKIALNFASGITHSFQNVVGKIKVKFDSTKGTLSGYGGPVESFETTFLPEDLEYKPNPHNPEHIEVSVSATGNLIRIYHKNCREKEHISITNITAVGTLTKVEDI